MAVLKLGRIADFRTMAADQSSRIVFEKWHHSSRVVSLDTVSLNRSTLSTFKSIVFGFRRWHNLGRVLYRQRCLISQINHQFHFLKRKKSFAIFIFNKYRVWEFRFGDMFRNTALCFYHTEETIERQCNLEKNAKLMVAG